MAAFRREVVLLCLLRHPNSWSSGARLLQGKNATQKGWSWTLPPLEWPCNGLRPLSRCNWVNGPSVSGLKPAWGHTNGAVWSGPLSPAIWLQILVNRCHRNTHFLSMWNNWYTNPTEKGSSFPWAAGNEVEQYGEIKVFFSGKAILWSWVIPARKICGHVRKSAAAASGSPMVSECEVKYSGKKTEHM